MTIGWAMSLLPFIKYLQGKTDAETVITQIADRILFSECVQDHTYFTISYSSLIYISRMSKDYDNAFIYAKENL